jgi:hypothetical protein
VSFLVFCLPDAIVVVVDDAVQYIQDELLRVIHIFFFRMLRSVAAQSVSIAMGRRPFHAERGLHDQSRVVGAGTCDWEKKKGQSHLNHRGTHLLSTRLLQRIGRVVNDGSVAVRSGTVDWAFPDNLGALLHFRIAQNDKRNALFIDSRPLHGDEVPDYESRACRCGCGWASSHDAFHVVDCCCCCCCCCCCL